MSNKESPRQSASTAVPTKILSYAGGQAALAELSQHKNSLTVSLVGVIGIVALLLVALGLPLTGAKHITSPLIFLIMVMAALGGVGTLVIISLRVHRYVTTQALLTDVLLNSLGQAYLSFDAEGVCGQVYSQACLDLLECAPAGRKIAEVLRLTDEQINDFGDWMAMIFTPDHALSFEDIVKFLPQSYAHSNHARHVSLLYRPVRDAGGRLLCLVLIATDQTEEMDARRSARSQQYFVDMICRIFKERNQFMATITHMNKFVGESRQPVKRAEAASTLRMLHTLKAAAKHFHLEELDQVIHKMEADLRNPAITSDQEFQSHLRKGGEAIDACIRQTLAQVSELIGQDYEGRGSMHEVEEAMIYKFADTLRDNKVDPELVRQYLLTIAAIPVREAFRQFEREIKDLAEIMGKKVKPVLFTGTNPRILLHPLEGFFLSLIHMSRNIIDHGIEPVVTRLARSKEPAGQITIHTDLIDNPHTGKKMLHIVISDDGNGIDPALVRNKLAKIDPNGSWRTDDDAAVLQRILLWEVSTRSEITDLSGRGVGMEAVDREIKLLGGSIKVYSDLYKGTRFDIRLPYGLDAHKNVIQKERDGLVPT